MRTVLTLVALAGCAEYAVRDDVARSGAWLDASTTIEQRSSEIRIDVLPSQLLDEDGAFRVLPVTVGPFAVSGDLDVGAIDLPAPVTVQGLVTADYVTPYAMGATLPTVQAPVDGAAVRIRQDGSVQSYLVNTDEDGRFAALVVPDALYEIAIVPQDPQVPFVLDELRVGQSPPVQDLHLDYGAAIWGQVLHESQPMSEVEVYARTEDGIRGASTLTAEDGTYVLRVPPFGSYEVVAEGSSTQPLLTRPGVAIDAIGVAVNFEYTDLSGVFRFGRVVGSDGTPLSDVTVRFESTSLEGYPNDDAVLAAQADTNSEGVFYVRLIAGTYEATLLPSGDDPGANWTPQNLDIQIIEGGLEDLGEIALPPFVPVSGTVRDLGGGVAGARISCREVGFEQREWNTYADEAGTYALILPQVPMDCTVTPPGERRFDLAMTRTRIEPGQREGFDLPLLTGARVAGTVALERTAEPYAIVEVRDASGELLGSALTEEDSGAFELRVVLP